MKLTKKDIIFWISITAIVVTLAIILLSGKDNDDMFAVSPSPSESPALSGEPTPVPASTGKTNNQKPDLIAEEVNSYEYWFSILDPKSMVLGVYEECSYLVPSNVNYKNNTRVMLDNTRSTKRHVLKIGNTEYDLTAGEWKLVTLSSTTIPVNMQIFCEGVELGQISLE